MDEDELIVIEHESSKGSETEHPAHPVTSRQTGAPVTGSLIPEASSPKVSDQGVRLCVSCTAREACFVPGQSHVHSKSFMGGATHHELPSHMERPYPTDMKQSGPTVLVSGYQPDIAPIASNPPFELPRRFVKPDNVEPSGFPSFSPPVSHVSRMLDESVDLSV
jgi:hypothetical protein